MFSRIFLLSFVLLTFGFFSTLQAATFTVDRNDNAAGANACTAAANDCSLRGAINNANNNGAGADTINFDLNPAVTVIQPLSALPVIKTSLTIDGTANAPADYLVNAGPISFAAGETAKNVFVTVNGDAMPEANETFYVQLTNPTNAMIGDNQGIGLILDDDTIAPASVGGTIKKSDNTPFGGATVNLTGTIIGQTTTDANGRYSFQNLQSGGNYTVSPSTVNYIFAPQNLQFTNLTTTDGTVIIMAAPTAAMVTVSGKVLTGQGRGVRNAMVMMTDADGNVRTTTTSTFGYYQFTEVPAGKTCVFNVSHKLYQFTQPSLILTIIEDAESVNFVAVQ